MTNTANCKREAGQDLQHQKREKGFYIELKKKKCIRAKEV